MSHNLIAYLLYGCITYYITVQVGLIFYRNGIWFIRAELHDEALAQSVNKLLLTCYYLTNLGYITLMIWFWEPIHSFTELWEAVCTKTGYIILLLGVLHVFNMTVIYLLRNKKINAH
jgi:hypothetical protein